MRFFDDYNDFNTLFDCVDGQHPPVARSFGGDLSIESFIIMDSILRFSSVFNQKIEESVM